MNEKAKRPAWLRNERRPRNSSEKWIERLEALLKECEWVPAGYGLVKCPICSPHSWQFKSNPHHYETCELAAVLAEIERAKSQ